MPIEILMPALSPTMSKTGGKIVKWCKRENDKIEVGDVIAEIETDKAIMELESVDEGTMTKILIPEGTSGIPVNQIIALMLEEGEDENTIDNFVLSSVKDEVKSEIKEPINSQGSNTTLCKSKDRIKVSPIARGIAQDKGVDIRQLKGTGPYGRIIKADVLECLNNDLEFAESKRTNVKDVISEVSNIRRVIAQRLVESKQNIPHFYLTIDCKVDKLVSLKNEINSASENNKVTINDLVIKACALSMKKFPDINSSWVNETILKYSNIDISVAVALTEGLITPIVKNADEKSILSISNEVKDLVSRARSGKLKPEEFQGGGFTISNLGMFGIRTFSAIINPPQSCIMAVGASEKRPIVVNETIKIEEIMTVTLSVDHRTVDGALGAKFLNAFKYYIENPYSILV
ncbi:pyruvate dehydrogenase complex dihydrolipoamide acetyltransferase [Wolbachia endosymbiont of Chironomus riparius]|uniref:pyruvate dehydrogenase complex dihydrolipoamide acetyltransferase n=1 Tax=Wolbachia endosymbiont of Chironomus riparius TaxID=2883238 RepID=UPI00209CB0C3|nr:pyruvate dehydrogenase complex dihydrolipoamide acetyltransferase [Wolbachia endosymbiont of Chironomus riparius]